MRIGAEIYDQEGQLIQAVQPRIDQVPFISIDYHQVLDRCNLSRRQSLRLTLRGQLHQRVLDGLTAAAQGATLLALSYCHAEDTRQNVRRALVALPQFEYVVISDDRIRHRGKLRVLERLISDRCLNMGRVYHIDDSWEVLTEVRDSQRIVPVGIRTHNRQRRIDGVQYCDNILEALDYVAWLDAQAGP